MSKKFPSLLSLLTRGDLAEYAIADLGQYAFAQKRNPGSEAPVEEPDTQEEDQMWRELRAHFQDNEALSYPAAASIISYLKSRKYPDVFQEPPADARVYRGISAPPSFFSRHGIYEFDDVAVGSVDRSLQVSPPGASTYKVWGVKPGESWTMSPRSAMDFATINMREGLVVVVMVANVSDNPGKFAVGKGGLYKVKGMDIFPSEDEVLAIGPINVSKVYWCDVGRGAELDDMDLSEEPRWSAP